MKKTNIIEIVGGSKRQKELAYSIAAFVIQKFLPPASDFGYQHQVEKSQKRGCKRHRTRLRLPQEV